MRPMGEPSSLDLVPLRNVRMGRLTAVAHLSAHFSISRAFLPLPG